MALNLLNTMQRTPATHMRTLDAQQRFAGPLCGQRDASGKGHARTLYSADPSRVTCRKCLKSLQRQQGNDMETTA